MRRARFAHAASPSSFGNRVDEAVLSSYRRRSAHIDAAIHAFNPGYRLARIE